MQNSSHSRQFYLSQALEWQGTFSVNKHFCYFIFTDSIIRHFDIASGFPLALISP